MAGATRRPSTWLGLLLPLLTLAAHGPASSPGRAGVPCTGFAPLPDPRAGSRLGALHSLRGPPPRLCARRPAAGGVHTSRMADADGGPARGMNELERARDALAGIIAKRKAQSKPEGSGTSTSLRKRATGGAAGSRMSPGSYATLDTSASRGAEEDAATTAPSSAPAHGERVGMGDGQGASATLGPKASRTARAQNVSADSSASRAAAHAAADAPSPAPAEGKTESKLKKRTVQAAPPVEWVVPKEELSIVSGDGTAATQAKINLKAFVAANSGWADSQDWAVDTNYAKGSDAPAAAQLGARRRGKGAGVQAQVQEMFRRAKFSGKSDENKVTSGNWRDDWVEAFEDAEDSVADDAESAESVSSAADPTAGMEGALKNEDAKEPRTARQGEARDVALSANVPEKQEEVRQEEEVAQVPTSGSDEEQPTSESNEEEQVMTEIPVMSTREEDLQRKQKAARWKQQHAAPVTDAAAPAPAHTVAYPSPPPSPVTSSTPPPPPPQFRRPKPPPDSSPPGGSSGGRGSYDVGSGWGGGTTVAAPSVSTELPAVALSEPAEAPSPVGAAGGMVVGGGAPVGGEPDGGSRVGGTQASVAVWEEKKNKPQASVAVWEELASPGAKRGEDKSVSDVVATLRRITEAQRNKVGVLVLEEEATPPTATEKADLQAQKFFASAVAAVAQKMQAKRQPTRGSALSGEVLECFNLCIVPFYQGLVTHYVILAA